MATKALNIKRALGGIAAFALGGCLVFATSYTGASADEASADEGGGLLYTAHEALGEDISMVSDVSVETCTAGGCHGGSFDAIIEATDGMWGTVGHLYDPNPHYAHAANAYTCESCHKLDGPSVLQCNGCHNFDVPEGWVEKDIRSNTYGVTTDEPIYSGEAYGTQGYK